MEIKAKEITLFPTNKLSEYPKNVNVHTKEQIDKIIQLIDFYGHRDPLIVDSDIQPDGTHWVMAGNGRLAAANKAGWENLPIIFQKFNSEEEKYGFMVSHNAVSSSGWGGGLDLAKINTDIIDLGPDFDIDFLGIKDFVIEPIEKFEPQSHEDNVPKVVHPITRKGDIWLLGNHRLMCGDSTMIDDVEKLMNGEKADITFTSPPYNALKNDYLAGEVSGFDNKYKNHNDSMDDEDYLNLIYQSTLNSIHKSNYAFINLQLLAHNKFVLMDYQIQLKDYLKDILIWNKKQCPPNIVKGAFNTKWEYVFCFSEDNKTRGFPVEWRGKFPNVVETESNAGNEFADNHKAGFPVAFPSWFFEKLDFAKSVFDPFCGTGTTLICAEKFNYKGYGMELDEGYCDVIINRWQNYTGNKATLELSGQTYEELKAERENGQTT